MREIIFAKTTILAGLLIVGGFFFLHQSAKAQSPQKSTSPRAEEQQERNTGGLGENGCTTRYDRFREHNTTMIEPRTIYRAGSEELKMGASAVVEANKAAPREIDLHFDSTTNRLRYGNSAEVRFIVDGKHLDGGVAYKSGGYAMRQFNEKLKLTMTPARFLEIMAGREVEMQLGETEVRLQSEDLQRMRDFAHCVRLKPADEQPDRQKSKN